VIYREGDTDACESIYWFFGVDVDSGDSREVTAALDILRSGIRERQRELERPADILAKRAGFPAWTAVAAPGRAAEGAEA
jgi:hypothetical protein